MRRIIIRNAIRRKNCGDVIESTYRHEFVTCSCGKVSVDGGHDYLRRCSETPDGYIELSETAAPEDETNISAPYRPGEIEPEMGAENEKQ